MASNSLSDACPTDAAASITSLASASFSDASLTASGVCTLTIGCGPDGSLVRIGANAASNPASATHPAPYNALAPNRILATSFGTARSAAASPCSTERRSKPDWIPRPAIASDDPSASCVPATSSSADAACNLVGQCLRAEAAATKHPSISGSPTTPTQTTGRTLVKPILCAKTLTKMTKPAATMPAMSKLGPRRATNSDSPIRRRAAATFAITAPEARPVPLTFAITNSIYRPGGPLVRQPLRYMSWN